jgi:CubicO group peptidase (beta-lactamase class C family)
MQLVERGTLPLDDDVRTTIPELGTMQILRGFDGDKPILEDNTKPITLRYCPITVPNPTPESARHVPKSSILTLLINSMLLTHVVGLGYDIPNPDLIKWSNYVGRTARNLDWSKEGFTVPFKFTPGEGWWYGTAIDWAALLLEAATGQTLGQYMKANILLPLGMEDTTFWPGSDFDARFVAYTSRRGDGSLEAVAPPVDKDSDHPLESGGAGLFSTARDYSTFMKAFLGGELLKQETMDEMFRPQLDDVQRAMLRKVVYEPGSHEGFAPEFPRGLEINHGLAGLVNLEDIPGKRAKGSMTWSGFCNSRWVRENLFPFPPEASIGSRLSVIF